MQRKRLSSRADHRVRVPVTALSRRAWTLLGMRRRAWRRVLRRTWVATSSDRISLLAAGCAFWATLALFPAISMLVSFYGLLFDPGTVEPQLDQLRMLLPPAAFELIEERVKTLVSHGGTTLGLSLGVSTALALWSASTGTKSMLSALNIVYGLPERRGFLVFQANGLLLTLFAVVVAVLGLAIMVAMPVVIGFIGLSAHTQLLVHAGAFALLMLFVLLTLALLYRLGPSQPHPRWRWITPGSLLATVLWLLASVLFSSYVAHLATYDATYGPLGAVAGVMMWFWVSAYVVLAGAELDANLAREHEAAVASRSAPHDAR
jgi:membrane protein